MKIVALIFALALSTLAWADEPGEAQKIAFQGNLGELPKDWKVAKTGKGTGGDWKLVEDKDSPAGLTLAQTKADKGAAFNLCVADKTSFADLDLTVSFKAIAGEIDEGGGPVWRFKDGDNYYVARMNPLEENFRLYKVVHGKRLQLGSAQAKAAEGKWHTIRVVHVGKKIECYFNGKKYLEAEDDALADAGKIGLWTKADAQTRFAGLVVKGK